MKAKKTIGQQELQVLEAHLQELLKRPPPSPRYGPREAVQKFLPLIQQLKKLGWTWDQIANELKAKGLPIAGSSIKQYASARRRSKPAAAQKVGEQKPKT